MGIGNVVLSAELLQGGESTGTDRMNMQFNLQRVHTVSMTIFRGQDHY